MITLKRMRLAGLALTAGGAALLGGGDGPVSSGSFISQAEARVGRPATPMSYADVIRRAVAYGTAAGAAVAAGTYYYVAPGCQQVVNSYGPIVYRCP